MIFLRLVVPFNFYLYTSKCVEIQLLLTARTSLSLNIELAESTTMMNLILVFVT